MHSLCFSGVHCIICDVRFQMKRTFKQVEVIGKEEMITHLPECSFLLYPISCFLSGLVSRVFSARFLLHFYRKIDFDPNLTPKHQKRKVEQDNISCSISFYRLTITTNSPCCKTISFTGVGVGGYIVINFRAMVVCRH